jgi:uncharacterized protein with FMN-binding domain
METKPQQEAGAGEAPATQQTPAATTTDAAKLQAEEYKDFGEYEGNIQAVPVDKKVVPTASFGHRIRIAKLFDNHEEFMYKIIQVAGWVRTARASGKEFMFVEINDGSCLKGLQVSK